ncbi:transposase [Lachnotalea glycerini]|uniref:Transposase n=1 Tax=Lachnotalea glycerini TaxID=1763509 RepID=A0A318ETM5_9FIRM|nr:transposase [Lachnotalea glycerini]PXV91550.1 transposase [Lachnotalea glycerini]
MQNEQTHRQGIEKQFTEPVEYIPRKFMCQLIYRELEDVKGLTQDQYQAALKKYPIFGKLYTLLKEYHKMVFSQKSSELDSWIEVASTLQVDELDSYIGGLKKDLSAVKNGIDHKYNNGLAEGSVNKIS